MTGELVQELGRLHEERLIELGKGAAAGRRQDAR